VAVEHKGKDGDVHTAKRTTSRQNVGTITISTQQRYARANILKAGAKMMSRGG
jgi:hypothetical protein